MIYQTLVIEQVAMFSHVLPQANPCIGTFFPTRHRFQTLLGAPGLTTRSKKLRTGLALLLVSLLLVAMPFAPFVAS